MLKDAQNLPRQRLPSTPSTTTLTHPASSPRPRPSTSSTKLPSTPCAALPQWHHPDCHPDRRHVALIPLQTKQTSDLQSSNSTQQDFAGITTSSASRRTSASKAASTQPLPLRETPKGGAAGERCCCSPSEEQSPVRKRLKEPKTLARGRRIIGIYRAPVR